MHFLKNVGQQNVHGGFAHRTQGNCTNDVTSSGRPGSRTLKWALEARVLTC